MCNPSLSLLWFPPFWLACWAAGAATASVPPAARLLLSSMPNSYRPRHWPGQNDFDPKSRMRAEMLRQRPDGWPAHRRYERPLPARPER